MQTGTSTDGAITAAELESELDRIRNELGQLHERLWSAAHGRPYVWWQVVGMLGAAERAVTLVYTSTQAWLTDEGASVTECLAHDAEAEEAPCAS